jgi:mannosyl-oligosaccharide alpha-1,2-mannosidase
MYIMWKTTRNPIWRERAWEIFERIERSTRLVNGYATLSRVDLMSSGFKDEMPRYVHKLRRFLRIDSIAISYLFAETFKHLYLSFLDPLEDPWPLSQYVFTTEAHPLPIFGWTDAEQQRYDAFRVAS